ncbi:MAG: hypothetical protein LC670_03940, partial [Flavobacteriales bacterium]|nr:hypothetical protein [Flavobacteriales bacterium]
MKRYYLLFIAAAITGSACTNLYNCGETRPDNFRANKKVTAVVDERDSLCTALASEEAENERLSSELAAKTSAYTELDSRHNNLKSDYKRLQDESAATTD